MYDLVGFFRAMAGVSYCQLSRMWTIQIALPVGGVSSCRSSPRAWSCWCFDKRCNAGFDVIDDGFPVLAGSIGPSHGFVHVVEIGTPVNIKGMRVAQGELIHADRHGALSFLMIIPDLGLAIRQS